MAGERRRVEDRAPAVPGWLERFDRAFIGAMSRWGSTLIRVTLGIVFVWFGALKVFAGGGPAAELVEQTVGFLPGSIAVPVLGAVEIAIGLGLVTGYAIRIVLLLFLLQMMGTFLVLAVRPEVAFVGGNPFHLSLIGEFVVKNLVLVAAGLALAARVRVTRAGEPITRMMGDRAES